MYNLYMFDLTVSPPSALGDLVNSPYTEEVDTPAPSSPCDLISAHTCPSPATTPTRNVTSEAAYPRPLQLLALRPPSSSQSMSLAHRFSVHASPRTLYPDRLCRVPPSAVSLSPVRCRAGRFSRADRDNDLRGEQIFGTSAKGRS